MAGAIVEELTKNSTDTMSYDTVDESIKESIQKHITDNALKIGENMQIAQVLISSEQCYAYTHPGDKVAAVVFYDGDEQKAKDIALQVAAMNPSYFQVSDVPAELVAELTVQAKEEFTGSGKPADMIEKIVAGKVSKQLAEDVLLEQESIKDSSQKVKDILGSTKISGYVRFSVK